MSWSLHLGCLLMAIEECLSTLRPIQSLSCLWWVRALTLSDRPSCAMIIRTVCINKAKAIHQSQYGATTASASLLIPLRHCWRFEVQTWKDYSECRERWRAVNSDYVEINEAEPMLTPLSLRTAAAVSKLQHHFSTPVHLSTPARFTPQTSQYIL